MILQQVKGYETSAWCGVCRVALRIHERDPETGRRKENDPGFTADHVVVAGVSLCIDCLQQSPTREILLGVLECGEREAKQSSN